MAVLRNLVADQKLADELAALRAENEVLRSRAAKKLNLKVSEKGAISIYGIRRFPVTFYIQEWEQILGMKEQIESFAGANGKLLSRKGE